jgi:hypothetical protein
MNRYEMVIIIVAIVMFASVMRARYSSVGRKAAAANDPEALRLKEEVRTLRERIQVLERIATERESTLEREIEQLRDR